MKHKKAVCLLGGLAVLAPLANLLGSTPLKAFAAATGASPAMKVFTSHDGYETFSPGFHIDWQSGGEAQTLTLTPATYAGVRGPYNRRNAYGAALSYSPVLAAGAQTRAMHAAVMRYALCDPAPVLVELGINLVDPRTPITVRIEPRRALDSKWQLDYTVTCDE